MKNKQRLVASMKFAMRITVAQIALPLLLMSSLYAKEANSQAVLQKTFSVSVTNKPLKKLISEIQKQTAVKFNFSNNAIHAERMISYSAREKRIIDFLEEMLKPIRISYQVIDNKVILFPVNDDHKAFAPIKVANDITVSGVINNDKGEPMSGVTVTEKGKNNVVATDEKGSFTIQVANLNAVLVFSNVGYESRELPVSDLTRSAIVLTATTRALEEIAVVAYGTQKKKDLTGSVSSVNAKDLKSLPVPGVGEALQGRAAGVQVISSGAPGSNVTFRIRGTGTINNSDPLLVIDGVPADLPRQVLHFINLATAANFNWRDTDGTQPVPATITTAGLCVNYTGTASKLWFASPDINNGVPQQLAFTRSGNTISFTLPELRYWDMVVIE